MAAQVTRKATRVVALACLAAVAGLAAETAEQILTRGIQEFDKHDYPAAETSFRAALKLSRADARAINYLALTQVAMGDCDGLGELKWQATRNPEDSLRRLSALAVIHCDTAMNRLGEALATLAELQQKYPTDPDVLFEGVHVYSRAWSATLTNLYREAPDSYRVFQMSAELLEGQGKYAEAAAEYQKAIAKNPKALNLHARLGHALLLSAKGDADKLTLAREACETEAKLNPRDPVAEYQLGEVFLAQNKDEEAINHFENALSLYPNFVDALVGIGKADVHEEKYNEAIRSLKRAVGVNPRFEPAHRALVLAYQGAHKDKDAEKEKAEADSLSAGRSTGVVDVLNDRSTAPDK